MNSQIERAEIFRSLHIPGDPIVLYNIWDAGSAIAVARGGAKAVATGSWSVAAAQGYSDGEEMPLDDALSVVARITKCVDLPLTVDFEGGYANDPAAVRQNVARLLALGVIGLNFEDQVVHGDGLHGIDHQSDRLRAVRSAASDAGVPVFINARTDVFLKAAEGVDHASLLDEAFAREAAYAAAGADGFFVPGLKDKKLIEKICRQASLPVNVMTSGDVEEVRALAELGVARISFGPAPYVEVSRDLESRARIFA
ncbi:isocitrate lyase/phosphoenolpyruvate mutase family protein [Agrobacterium tumefaciens]|uniref:isocitrate lyase/PEP mutase family protein n=1 Tax=Agrobacterium tumefaciens TaxID=358 RepID=UPI001573D5CC|nr:isocitrate lyase/phosphoenolpyruvate mutase family protein [Agrobacterium tumefaciens]NTE53468.1 isocitrate lyase/phosphoenolpyruvate mutase family protein [Agrobacterium tumefaciens]NTE70942.1 isocitrate lyase/phosphoenolpyruvate mutase family protein [Agrobacterium tumefaciens]